MFKKVIMSKVNFQKIKLVKLLEILRRDSDEDRPIKTNDLITKLREQGIECSRKILYKDIEELNYYGYEILKLKGQSNMYYIVDRSFDIAELKVLIDAVQAASFITEKKTKQLIDKIAALGGSYRASLLKHNIVCFDTIKHTNEKIYYYVDTIDKCILSNKQLSFLYFDYRVSGGKEYRKDKQRYTVNPITLICSHDNYYLVCYNDKYKNISNYRVDRMDNVKQENADINQADCGKDFNINKYRKEVFSMFTGKTEQIELLAHNDLIDIIIDKFGENVKMTAHKEYFTIKVQVQTSPTFFSWCCSFGTRLKVISPENVIKELKEHIKEIRKNYI